jgi:hypothetical protein
MKDNTHNIIYDLPQNATVIENEREEQGIDKILMQCDISESFTPIEKPPSGCFHRAWITGINESGHPIITISGNPTRHYVASSVVPVSPHDKGREVALGYCNGEEVKPIIMGFMWEPKNATASGKETNSPEEEHLKAKKLVLTGEREVVIKCGKSSITLTQAGKIIISGEYISSRSSGVNKLQGASVRIN